MGGMGNPAGGGPWKNWRGRSSRLRVRSTGVRVRIGTAMSLLGWSLFFLFCSRLVSDLERGECHERPTGRPSSSKTSVKRFIFSCISLLLSSQKFISSAFSKPTAAASCKGPTLLKQMRMCAAATYLIRCSGPIK